MIEMYTKNCVYLYFNLCSVNLVYRFANRGGELNAWFTLCWYLSVAILWILLDTKMLLFKVLNISSDTDNRNYGIARTSKNIPFIEFHSEIYWVSRTLVYLKLFQFP